MSTYTVSVLINGNASGYRRAAGDGERATTGFVEHARREFGRLRQFMQTYQGQLAGLGLSVGFVQMQRQAALLDKQLTQVRLTAGMTAKEQTEAYRSMFDMVKRNGGVLEDTVGGFNSLVQAGLKFQEAIRATDAINDARPVTGAGAETLANALSMASGNFGFDLSKTGVATQVLDDMTVAARLGNAEMENLANIFPRVATNAKMAGMSFRETLAFIEALSLVEKQPERLATLADSTLRLFTNAKYAKDAEKALGVKFFDGKGARRNPLAVLDDMRKKYVALTTDAQRFNFMEKAFGSADLDTKKGAGLMFGGDVLTKMRQFGAALGDSGGTIKRDLPTALGNAADQAARLKNTLRESAEGFARPINDAVTRSIKYLLDAKKDGGLGLSGGQIAGGGIAAALAAYAAGRAVPGLAGRLLGRAGGVGAGVAAGHALQAAAGVMPVYVVNWTEMAGKGGGIGDLGVGAAAGAGGLAVLAKMKAALAMAAGAPMAALPLAYAAGGVGIAGAIGYGGGSLLYKGIENTSAANGLGEFLTKVLAVFGNENAQEAVAIREAIRDSKVGGELMVKVLASPTLAVQNETRPFNGTKMSVDTGRHLAEAGW